MDSLQASRIAGGNTAYKRAASDFYPTPPDVTFALMKFLSLEKGAKIWEPACGDGHMVRVMEAMGYQVIGTDIQSGNDFLTAPLMDCDWIITNPPFSQSEAFIDMTKMCDYDEAFTRREMYEETGRCLKCKVNPKCPMHIKAIEEEYGVRVERGRR